MKSDIQRRRLRKPTSRNALGVLGVNKVGRQFRSRLELGELKLHLGYYPSPDDAEAARALALAALRGPLRNYVEPLTAAVKAPLPVAAQ